MESKTELEGKKRRSPGRWKEGQDVDVILAGQEKKNDAPPGLPGNHFYNK
jgi:hypothetical protein